jgi:hypothetical protein
MSRGKLLLYAAGILVGLVAVAFVVQTVLAAIAFVLGLLRILAILAVLGGVGYVGYKLYSLVSGNSSTEETTSTGEFSMGDIGTTDESSTGATRADDLRQQYLNGEISEEEFERRLERELDSGEFDSIDRELQRERI